MGDITEDLGLDNGANRFQEIRLLTTFGGGQIREKSKAELVGLVEVLSRELLDYRDLTCGPESAARFFNRKRSWIYEAMSRPGTDLQRGLSKVVAREPGGLLFRLSDLVQLRRQLFNQGEDS